MSPPIKNQNPSGPKFHANRNTKFAARFPARHGPAFRLMAQQRWAGVVADAAAVINTCLGLLICLVLHKRRAIVYRRICLIVAIVYAMRACCLGLTYLPSSYTNARSNCLPQVSNHMPLSRSLMLLCLYGIFDKSSANCSSNLTAPAGAWITPAW